MKSHRLHYLYPTGLEPQSIHHLHTSRNIDNNECQRLCSLYYNRPFEFGECGDRNIRDYASDYTVTHEKVNAPLTHHLKVGKDPIRLVRIYYFYDKTDRMIVVGSMPKHLRIACYS